MRVHRAGQGPGRYGPDSRFTGAVWIEDRTSEGSSVRPLAVHFTPAARTHWHQHPEGQLLYIVYGRGLVQEDGSPAVEVGPGDVVHSAPGERHWHGAAPGSVMVHVAIAPAFETDGEADWGEGVSDEEYEAAQAASE